MSNKKKHKNRGKKYNSRKKQVKKVRKKFKGEYEGKDWRNVEQDLKRKERYNKSVWKGWDRQEKPGEVKTYYIDVDKKKDG